MLEAASFLTTSTKRGALRSVLSSKYYWGDHIKRMRWVGHVVGRGKGEVHTGYL